MAIKWKKLDATREEGTFSEGRVVVSRGTDWAVATYSLCGKVGNATLTYSRQWKIPADARDLRAAIERTYRDLRLVL